MTTEVTESKKKSYRMTDYVQSAFYLGGQYLSLARNKRRHLHPIYNNPLNSILMKFARQTEKSSTIAYKALGNCTRYRHFHALYVAPTGKQVSVFSNDKVASAVRESRIVQKYFINTKTKDQVEYKELANGSKFYARSAYLTADSARGISSDMCVFDEVQDLFSDHIPVIEQSMAHSLEKWESNKKTHPKHIFMSKIYAGTPKTIENTLEDKWRQSTQCEWIIKCTHCNKFNYIDDKNIGKEFLICRKCGKDIFYEMGQWYGFNPDAIIDGFRLPQIVLPWINDRSDHEKWQKAIIETRELYNEQKFFNEILALPYASSSNPVSTAHIQACCVGDRKMSNEPSSIDPTFPLELVAGIDWGKGDTARGTSFSILNIGGIVRGGKFRNVFSKRYVGIESDPIEQINDMLYWIKRFRVKLTIADFGDGRTSNAMMAKELSGNRFGEVYASHTSGKKIKWDPTGKYIINRTQLMTDCFMEIRHGMIEWWNYEEFKTFAKDILSIFVDYSEKTRMTRYDHTNPDDYFHAFMYSRIACNIIRGIYDKYLF